MKVTLVNPAVGLYNEMPPLGLMFIGSYLEKFGHDVEIVNRLCGDSLPRSLDRRRPDLVGITGTTQAIPWAYNCADYCRSLGLRTVIGGIHASALPQEALQHADTVIVGEGEKAMLSLLDNPRSGIVMGEPVENLDDLPPPAYHLVNMNYYTSCYEGILSFMPVTSHNLMGCLLTSRGCPYRCIYCYNSFRDAPIRYSSPRRVIDDVKMLKSRYAVNFLCFLEDNFFVNKPRAREICRLLIGEGVRVKWSANGRVDNVDLDLLKLAREAGCVQVAFGFESGNQRVLDVLKKDIKIEDSVEAVKLCDEANIIVSGSFMFGNPTETMSEIKDSVSFMSDNNIDGGIGVCLTMPFPGTELWDWCKAEGRIPEDIDWRYYDYQHRPIKVSDISDKELTRTVNAIRGLGAVLFDGRAPSRNKKLFK